MSFLTDSELETFADYKNKGRDGSVTTRLLEPFLSRLLTICPRSVSPNVLSLAALLGCVQAYIMCYQPVLFRNNRVAARSAAAYPLART